MGERYIMAVKTDEGGREIVIDNGSGERHTVATIHNISSVPGFNLPTEDALTVLAGVISGEIMRLNPEVPFWVE